jgi:His-Xaa-Ser system protein HxsD
MFTVLDGVVTIEINQDIYTRDAVLRTAYWFTDRCYIFIGRSANTGFRVTIKAKAVTLERPVRESPELLVGEFCNALLENQLRQDIEAQTGKIRELIVAKAFAESGILADDPPGDIDDPVDAAMKLVHLPSGGSKG